MQDRSSFSSIVRFLSGILIFSFVMSDTNTAILTRPRSAHTGSAAPIDFSDQALSGMLTSSKITLLTSKFVTLGRLTLVHSALLCIGMIPLGEGFSPSTAPKIKKRKRSSRVRILVFANASKKEDFRSSVWQHIPEALRKRVVITQVEYRPEIEDSLQVTGGPYISGLEPRDYPMKLFQKIGEPDVLLFPKGDLPRIMKMWNWQILGRAVLVTQNDAPDATMLSSLLELHDHLDARGDELPGRKTLGAQTWPLNAIDRLRNVLLLQLMAAKNRSKFNATLKEIENTILPFLQKVHPGFVQTYPTVDDWLAFALMHYTGEFFPEPAVSITEPLFHSLVSNALRWASLPVLAHLYAAFGAHLRYVAGDEDIFLSPQLLKKIAGYFQGLLLNAAVQVSGSTERTQAERFAGALVNGLIFHLGDENENPDGYKNLIDTWHQELKKSNIDLQALLRAVFTEFKMPLPAQAPEFTTAAYHVTGDRLGDFLSRRNARGIARLSSWEILTGAAAANATLRALRKMRNEIEKEIALKAAEKYDRLRSWALIRSAEATTHIDASAA